MKAILIALTFVVAAATGKSATLVNNGDFSSGVATWQIDVAPPYGTPNPVVRVNEGALEFAGLHPTSPGNLSINQAVDIKKGTRYRLKYEVKGDGGNYVVAIQHSGKAAHASKETKLSQSWKTVTIEFAGKYDTDSDWVRQWREATAKNEVRDGGTPNGELSKIPQPSPGDPPSQSILIFSIGAVQGAIAIRNVSIVEVK